MSLEVWQTIPAVEDEELRPIMSRVSDWTLVEQVNTDIGLTRADSLFSMLHTYAQDFRNGRLVVVSALRPRAVQARVEADLSQPADEARWLRSADYVMRLTEQQSQGCYGGWHRGFSLTIFGQE